MRYYCIFIVFLICLNVLVQYRVILKALSNAGNQNLHLYKDMDTCFREKPFLSSKKSATSSHNIYCRPLVVLLRVRAGLGKPRKPRKLELILANVRENLEQSWISFLIVRKSGKIREL